MKRFRNWLLGRFLPEYCKQSLLEENGILKLQISELEQELSESKAYIRGLEYGVQKQKHILTFDRKGG